MEQNSNKLAQSDRTGSNEFYKIFKVFISLTFLVTKIIYVPC